MKKPFEFILSNQNKNSYGFIVLTSGIDLSEFENNPVMLHNHNENQLIGKWNNVRVEGTELVAEAQFDMEDALGKEMAGKVERGFLKGVSIGMCDLHFEYGVAGFEDMVVATKCKIFEASLTPIPSNGDALRLYNNEGKLMSKEEISVLLNKNNQNQNIMKNLGVLVALLALNADATEEKVIEATRELLNKNKKLEGDLATLTAERDKYKGEVDAVKVQLTAANDAQAVALVEGAEAAKKINAAQKEQFLKLAKSDYTGTKAILDGMTAHVGVTAQLNNTNSNGTGEDKYKAWSFAKLTKEAPKELARIKAEEPERYGKLLKEYIA